MRPKIREILSTAILNPKFAVFYKNVRAINKFIIEIKKINIFNYMCHREVLRMMQISYVKLCSMFIVE